MHTLKAATPQQCAYCETMHIKATAEVSEPCLCSQQAAPHPAALAGHTSSRCSRHHCCPGQCCRGRLPGDTTRAARVVLSAGVCARSSSAVCAAVSRHVATHVLPEGCSTCGAPANPLLLLMNMLHHGEGPPRTSRTHPGHCCPLPPPPTFAWATLPHRLPGVPPSAKLC
jgi:hypothetical protein